MSVAQHLGIQLSEYDQRIRTFIPNYEEMLETVAAMVRFTRRQPPRILDLGIGTGALAERCLAIAPRAELYGIDADPEILALAELRLSGKKNYRAKLLPGSFLETPLPRCDAVVATLALHHIGSAQRKQKFYAKCFSALQPGGILVNGDCAFSANARLARYERKAWQAHLAKFYSASKVKMFFAAWAQEDTYFSLGEETRMLTKAGFEVEVVWRCAPFAVLLGWKR